MQSLNVLVVGKPKSDIIEEIQSSKYLNKLYITSDNEVDGCIAINFNTFKELAEMCKALQVDVVLVNEEKWILEGITNVMKQHYINCFAVTSEWTEIGLSHSYARKLMTKYGIDVPPIINLPVEFPVLVKGNGILRKADSLQDIIDIRQKIANTMPEISKTVFLEKYLHNTKHKVTSIYDGKSLLTFPDEDINPIALKEYSDKLNNMFLKEKANFIGFFNSELIEDEGVLYNTGFSFEFISPKTKTDLLFLCLAAIYQKLNEIDI